MWFAFRRALALIVRLNAIPDHIGFIMDGNRRFADRQGVERLDGHTLGYKKVRRKA